MNNAPLKKEPRFQNVDPRSESGVNLNRERTRFAKFLVVGTIGAVVDFGTLFLLTTGFHFWPIPSSVVSFLAAVTSNFFFNRYWTYPDSRSKPLLHQAILFTGINLVGLAIRTPLLAFLIPLWTSIIGNKQIFLPFSNQQLSLFLAWGCAVFVVLIWNFVVNRFWTYNDIS
jgi:putative flippase GtrA